jgi:hypothetical protein
MPTTLLIDDQDPQIQYLCPSSHQKVAGSFYNNTWTAVQDDECQKGWFEYTFYGTGVHVATSIAHPGANYSVKIDDGPFIAQSGNGPFTSALLSDGKHTITYAAGAGQPPPLVDYLAVTTGSLTPLHGKTIVADDMDDTIIYSGAWTDQSLLTVPFDYSTSLYRNTTHWSTRIGDHIRFEFQGTSISVYGIVANISSGGNITAEYTVDGVKRTQGLSPGTLDSLPMVELFHADVEAGNHTFTMNITDIQVPQSLGIDFITYNASAPNDTNPKTNTSDGSRQIPPWGIRVVIIVSVLAACLLLGSFVILLWRKKRIRKHLSESTADQTTHIIEFGSRRSTESAAESFSKK